MPRGLTEWQRRRSELNHDWLKNRYIVPLNNWLALLAGEIEDEAFERKFLAEILSQWETHHDELCRLVADYETAESPRELVHQTHIFRSVPDSEWVAELSHRLWLCRYPIREWIDTASEAIRSAQKAYEAVRETLPAACGVKAIRDLRHHASVYRRFRDACLNVGSQISRFPRQVRTT